MLEQGELFLAYTNTSSRFALLFFGYFQKGADTAVVRVNVRVVRVLEEHIILGNPRVAFKILKTN